MEDCSWLNKYSQWNRRFRKARFVLILCALFKMSGRLSQTRGRSVLATNPATMDTIGDLHRAAALNGGPVRGADGVEHAPSQPRSAVTLPSQSHWLTQWADVQSCLLSLAGSPEQLPGRPGRRECGNRGHPAGTCVPPGALSQSRRTGQDTVLTRLTHSPAGRRIYGDGLQPPDHVPETNPPHSCPLRVPKPLKPAVQVAWPGWASALRPRCFSLPRLSLSLRHEASAQQLLFCGPGRGLSSE